MMTCEVARQALLEVDAAELRGEILSPLTEHLAACPACRALADRLLMTIEALRSERDRRPRLAAAEATARAISEAHRIRHARRRWMIAVPSLAAAGIAAVMLARDWTPSLPFAPSTPSAPTVAAPILAAAASNVAVFATDNPNIVIIWQF